MAPKSSKIFIQRANETVEFMWADVTKDQPVMVGLLADAIEEVEFVRDPERGEVRKPALVTEARLGRPKISFHASGQYKLEGRMGLDPRVLDRATVEGPRLADISAPRRMLEVLLPKALPDARLVPTSKDIVLTADEESNRPMRCTITCMGKPEYQRIVESTDVRYVDTSEWESTGALENDSHVWTWTLRASKNDEHFSDKVRMLLAGSVKWASALPQ